MTGGVVFGTGWPVFAFRVLAQEFGPLIDWFDAVLGPDTWTAARLRPDLDPVQSKRSFVGICRSQCEGNTRRGRGDTVWGSIEIVIKDSSRCGTVEEHWGHRIVGRWTQPRRHPEQQGYVRLVLGREPRPLRRPRRGSTTP